MQALASMGKYKNAIDFFHKLEKKEKHGNGAIIHSYDGLKELSSKLEACQFDDDGCKLRMNGEFQKSIEYFDKALEITGEGNNAAWNKMQALASLGKYVDAIDFFHKIEKYEKHGRGSELCSYDGLKNLSEQFQNRISPIRNNPCIII